MNKSLTKLFCKRMYFILIQLFNPGAVEDLTEINELEFKIPLQII